MSKFKVGDIVQNIYSSITFKITNYYNNFNEDIYKIKSLDGKIYITREHHLKLVNVDTWIDIYPRNSPFEYFEKNIKVDVIFRDGRELNGITVEEISPYTLWYEDYKCNADVVKYRWTRS